MKFGGREWNMANTLRFVVMGDTHYVQPESHKEVFAGRPKGVTDLVDCTRNLWLTRNVVPEAIAAIAAMKPDFVIQTGDIMQGHGDDAACNMREMTEALQMLDGLQAPLFFALGTHDGTVGKREEEPVLELVYPAIGKALGTAPVTKGYYTFVKNNSLFIILDYTTYSDQSEQAEFIERALAESGKYEHVFLFAHPPLIPVGRPFFTHFNFVQKVLKEVANHPIDAYFCGHTHNQVTTLHKVGDAWMPQLKSTVLGYPDRPPVPLTDVRPLTPPPDSFEYGWGYLEDSAPGWWLITVDGEEVTADWYVLRQGPVGQLQWRRGEKPEKPQFTKRPTFQGTFGSPLPPVEKIRSVQLRAAGSSCKTPDAYKVELNGQFIGILPRLEYFDCRQTLDIDRQYWPLLRQSNSLLVHTADEPMGIGGFVLEVETDEGCVRSTVSNYFASTNRWDMWGESPFTKMDSGVPVRFELHFGIR
jgi:predicted MPP superfamily phosphohydrolase